MKKKIVIYLATPYAFVNKSKEIGINKPDWSNHDKEIRAKRFEAVNKVAAELIEKGFAVISPISQSHPIAIQEGIEGTFDTWADMDYNILSRCDMVFIFCQDGWDKSEGVQKEAIFAKQNNIPVFRIDNELRILGVW
jgi:nucleoside 2-deoxyribosyltransferase